MSKFRPVVSVGWMTLVAAFVCAACEKEAGSPGKDGGLGAAVTSATPGVKSAALTAAHPGWGLADCLGCHAVNHASSYDPADCTGCHGVNNAPVRPQGHEDAGCDACHAGQHKDLAFAAPADCISCHRFSGASCGVTETYDVVVIGGGGGGLAAAARLSLAGKKVIVLEKNYRVGGCIVNFRRGDFRIEASLHGFDGLNRPDGMNVSTFRDLGILDLVKPVKIAPTMYKAVYPDKTYEVPADIEQYRTLMKTEFPDQAASIDRLWDEMLSLHDILQRVFTAETDENGFPVGVEVQDLQKMMHYMDITTQKAMEELGVTDIHVQGLFTQLAGFAGAKPSELDAMLFAAMWANYHDDGYYYFEGGSESFIEALAKVVRGKGGVIRTNTTAKKIVIQDGLATQVQTEDGGCYNARYVVSNAPAPATMLEMVGRDYLPADYLAKLDTWRVGLSIFGVYLGMDYDFKKEFGSAHEWMFAESYDQEVNFATIDACDVDRASWAIVNYTMVDPTSAPSGKSSLQLITQLGYNCFSNWAWDSGHAAYKQKKEEIAKKLIARAEKYIPGLSKHIEMMEIATPYTIQGFTGAPRGSIFGWDTTVEQSMMKRTPQQTPIPNLYLAGAWTFPGPGQSAVLVSGMQVANTIIKADQ